MRHLVALIVLVFATLLSSHPAFAQFLQQGPKLVGTGAVGNAYQGFSVSLSADGNTAIVGGYADNSSAGATWIWTRSGGVWTQQGTKLVGTDAVGTSLQGSSVSLSADGNTAIVGWPADNGAAGAARVFASAPPRVWTSGGPPGGVVSALAIDLSTPATIHAGTNGGGVFKSTNGGNSWTAVNSGLTICCVISLAIDPSSGLRRAEANRQPGSRVRTATARQSRFNL